ncbi:MAG: DUF58 domain-containing protein [Lachnospira sp.]|jgi:uncharacterized protein (DUF58 family)|uniref:DUF58 domain-containing protein n=1 Tax=Lachnospira sp. TaxID=2049031 RepID=UPI00257BB614|nr:DUF58 domain-containing protein [Lachnospira sp.]MBQ2473060.1 DUF58 domain-containing protein [Lachnospira sp.]
MNIILMIVAVALVYFFVVTLYRKNWSKNLKMNLNFESRNVIRGDSTNLVLTVSNAKKLPLAMINTKFQLDKSLYFTDIDTNSTTTDRTYRNDVFSLGPNQKITRRIPIKCLKRGVFTLDNLEIVFNGVFMDEVNVCKQDATAFITVYPQAIDVNKLGIINNSLEGDLTKKKYLFEDKFAFRSIREYNYNDNLKSVNWKASAKTGQLMVNEYDETMSRNVCILLNLEKDRQLESLEIIENSIELCSGFATKFLKEGVNLSLYSNARDYLEGAEIKLSAGSGVAHLKTINALLARVDASKEKRDFKEIINELQIKRDSIYVIISANRQKELVDLINEKFKNDKDSLWVVPHFRGENISQFTELKSLEFEIDQNIGGKL